uniref:Uncharacterized protein n=1 Tax=Plectus sambesii TaxID=2011161 RepID=A0A914VZA3_9BILA
MRALAVLLAVSTALWLVAWGSFDVKETTPARCDPGCVNGVCNNGT